MSRLEILYDGQTMLERDVGELTLSDSASGDISLSAKCAPIEYEVAGPTGDQIAQCL